MNDSSVVTPTPTESRVRAEPAPPTTAARRLAAVMDIRTTAAQELAVEAYRAAKCDKPSGVWRSFLIGPSMDMQCSVTTPAADEDQASATLVAVWQRLAFASAMHKRLGSDSSACIMPVDLVRMVDEWMPVLTQFGTLRRFLSQSIYNESARLKAVEAKRPQWQRNASLDQLRPAFWADERTRAALERMAGRRARNTRWAELSQRRAHLATGSHAWPPRPRSTPSVDGAATCASAPCDNSRSVGRLLSTRRAVVANPEGYEQPNPHGVSPCAIVLGTIPSSLCSCVGISMAGRSSCGQNVMRCSFRLGAHLGIPSLRPQVAIKNSRTATSCREVKRRANA